MKLFNEIIERIIQKMQDVLLTALILLDFNRPKDNNHINYYSGVFCQYQCISMPLAEIF